MRQRGADHNGERAAICDAELFVGPVEVDLHSGLRDGGFPRDLFVGQPLGHKPANLRFARRQQLLKSQGARLARLASVRLVLIKRGRPALQDFVGGSVAARHGKSPREKPAFVGRERAQSARSREGGAKGPLGVIFGSEAPVVSLISWHSPYPVSLPCAGSRGPRNGEGEAGDGAVSPQRKPPRRAVEVAARLDALRP